MNCSSCGGKILDRASFCTYCGAAVPVFKRVSLNNTFAWLFVVVPHTLSIALGVIRIIAPTASVLLLLLYVLYPAAYFTFAALDYAAVNRATNNIHRGWTWVAFLFAPVYLFIRAAKIDKKYGYAIVCCVLLGISRLTSLVFYVITSVRELPPAYGGF